MKKYFLLATVAIAFIACNQKSSQTESSQKDTIKSSQNFAVDTTKMSAGQVYYQCPMHPEVISDVAGICPKCEMDLEAVTKS